MFVETITLGAIFGASAVAVLLMKNRFHPQIERSLVEIERESIKREGITPNRITK